MPGYNSIRSLRANTIRTFSSIGIPTPASSKNAPCLTMSGTPWNESDVSSRCCPSKTSVEDSRVFWNQPRLKDALNHGQQLTPYLSDKELQEIMWVTKKGSKRYICITYLDGLITCLRSLLVRTKVECSIIEVYFRRYVSFNRCFPLNNGHKHIRFCITPTKHQIHCETYFLSALTEYFIGREPVSSALLTMNLVWE